MALALSAPPEHHPTAERSSAQPLHKRAMLAGVAVVGASVLTVTPVAPAPAALTAAAQALDVQMTASTNPFVTWRDTLEVASQNIAYGLNEVATKYPIWLGDVLRGSPTLFQEVGGVFGNSAGWQALVADLPEYGERIRTAIQTSIEDSEGQFDGLGEMLQDVVGYLGQAQFNNAFATVNEYFLWSLGAGAWPLFDVFYMPGQIAETLGADKLANVFDVLLTDNALGHYTESLLGPVVTAAFQFTEVLDDIAVAIKAGDWTTALSETANMPGKVTNALLNGYTPRLAIEDGKPWPWVGLLTPKGAFETFFINLPRDIAWALKVSREEFLEAKNPTAASADVSSTDLAAEDRLVAVEVGLRGEERKLSETTPAVSRSEDDAEATRGPESPETPATAPEPTDSQEATDETTEPSEKSAESSEETEAPGQVETPEAPSETEESSDTDAPSDADDVSGDAEETESEEAESEETPEAESQESETGSSNKSGSSSSSGGGSDGGSSSRKSSSND